MANRKDKKGQETTGVDPDAAMGNPTINALNAREFGDPVDQTEAMADMGPRGSLAKVNPETNDLYYPEGAPAPARVPARSVAKAPAAAPARTPGNRDLEKGMSRGSGAGRESRYDYSNEGRTYEPKVKPKAKYETPYDRMNRENREAGIKFKKGGAVKKMASGGMTSASKRADGIASRGKTKCKMY
jgi:hypothetical protein